MARVSRYRGGPASPQAPVPAGDPLERPPRGHRPLEPEARRRASTRSTPPRRSAPTSLHRGTSSSCWSDCDRTSEPRPTKSSTRRRVSSTTTCPRASSVSRTAGSTARASRAEAPLAPRRKSASGRTSTSSIRLSGLSPKRSKLSRAVQIDEPGADVVVPAGVADEVRRLLEGPPQVGNAHSGIRRENEGRRARDVGGRRRSAGERVAVGDGRDSIGAGDVGLHPAVRRRTAGAETFQRARVPSDGRHGDCAAGVRGKRQRADTRALRRIDPRRAPDPEPLSGVERARGIVVNDDERETAVLETHGLHRILAAVLEIGAGGDDVGVRLRKFGVAEKSLGDDEQIVVMEAAAEGVVPAKGDGSAALDSDRKHLSTAGRRDSRCRSRRARDPGNTSRPRCLPR